MVMMVDLWTVVGEASVEEKLGVIFHGNSWGLVWVSGRDERFEMGLRYWTVFFNLCRVMFETFRRFGV
jgi:hypothetical protein